MTTNPIKPTRRDYIDWLRVLAVLLLMLNHTACIFDIFLPFYIENAQKSKVLSYLFLNGFEPWHMPLFFLLAGASTWFALSFRSAGEYVAERFKRLIIPFIFAQLVLVPPQSYIGLRSHKGYTGSFWQFYPRFFEMNPEGIEGYTGGYTPGHLWFVPVLFILAMVALPGFLFLKSKRGQRLIGGLAALCARPGGLFLLVIPMLLMDRLPGVGPLNPFLYLTVFVYGFILMADPHFTEAVDRHKAAALILGLVTLATMIGVPALGIRLSPRLDAVLVAFYRSFTAWCCLVALLGYGRKYLNLSGKVLRYASEAAYPFYILHQTVIVLVGAVVVRWSIAVLPKFLIIAVASTIVSVLVYEVAIRHISVMRFLFGMKPKQRA